MGLGVESQVIGRYVAEKYNGQGTPLLGNTLTEKAIINKWVEVEGQNHYYILCLFAKGEKKKPEGFAKQKQPTIFAM